MTGAFWTLAGAVATLRASAAGQGARCRRDLGLGGYHVARMVHCVKLGTEAEGLDRPPYPGPLGVRIYQEVSKAAWQDWLKHQTMLINEYRLSPIDPKSRSFLEKQMEAFFFGDGAQTPEGFVPEQKD